MGGKVCKNNKKRPKMPESRGKGLKPPKVVYNLKFLGLYAFSGISFSYLKLTHGKPLCSVKWSLIVFASIV